MTGWFESLDFRERVFVSLGAVFVVVTLVYFLIWSPLAGKHSNMRDDVENWQRALADLKPLQALAASGGQAGAATVGSRQSPIIIVDQTLSSRGLDRYRRSSRPTTSNGIRVEFENVAFDELVVWLGDLSGNYAMHVQAGSFSTGSQVEPGRVNATLTLERSP